MAVKEGARQDSYSVTERVMRLEQFAAAAIEAIEAAPRSALARRLREQLIELHLTPLREAS